MKMIVMMADEARWPAVRDELAALGAPGYSAVPVIEGSGRTGTHSGDRVHPGGLVMVLIVAADGVAAPLFEALVRRRDEAHDSVSRLFMVPVERDA